MEPQKLSHLSKNSHEKARFDFGADLFLGMDLNNDVDIHVGRPGTMCYGTLRYAVSWGLRRDGGQGGWGEEEEKRRRGARTFPKWTPSNAPSLAVPMSHDIFKGPFQL
ncbi:hypothetical protein N7471_005805 [Penicillium samsonianum]|uniref:uncharacterized protein n=1 Tax=Penicillium samsonianum TaxID=1882272 RepID=UPI0025498628|nr:uncharacterized protein N7471_005805 [Penicillium samsonianum]KAJ6139319.1 hypothetical protein N7471_005805 [Penicillium samsonianum]